MDLQEKKRELAKQTIEGQKGGAGKLGMKEILQLFRRDAEHAPPHPAAPQYDMTKPRVLKEASSNASSSQEGSLVPSRERKSTPPANGPNNAAPRENDVYSRRW